MSATIDLLSCLTTCLPITVKTMQASARIEMKEKGGEIEWGVHYGGLNKYSFTKAEVGERPTASEE